MDAAVVIASIDEVGTDTIAVEFESPDGFEAEPGQFIKLTGTVDGEEYSRFYTLSSPDVEGTFETTIEIDHEEGGPFSAYLASLEPGDELEMSGPFGSDHYEGERRVVVLAGGPGIGPAVGIGERALADGNEAAIVYRDDAPAHRERLADLEDRGATVRLLEDGTADLADAVSDVATGAPEEQVFVYGFASFIEDVEAALEAAGSGIDGAKVENFG
ncbi:FAD-dependent oxidoreductase [Halopenitus persicus]|uniref:Ferredoxin-NADP reductase n=1 Tax=Halopenitus persicus TaxID=1048396 RepID=A0A1H3IMJ6_9EURY|nr:FAD-dependent oxidoreductase [Halopenitus persicus]SDY28298.1 Ferredoxin-NADP reductase [Halopenitus persicus]